MTLMERMEELKRAQAQMPDILADIAETATLRAVKKAEALTPPTADDLSGTHTLTSELKQHWATDSKTEPMGGALSGGTAFVTILANDKEYVSYVDEGHRMDRHFVPGLYINPESGLLEYDPAAEVGLVVGTQTTYVPGLHMVDAAKEEYHRAVQEGFRRLEALLE